jgi:hypothetical protein
VSDEVEQRDVARLAVELHQPIGQVPGLTPVLNNGDLAVRPQTQRTGQQPRMRSRLCAAAGTPVSSV